MVESYDPAERKRQKQAQREQDDRDLAKGRISREELARRNGFFSCFDIKNARIVRPGKCPDTSESDL